MKYVIQKGNIQISHTKNTSVHSHIHTHAHSLLADGEPQGDRAVKQACSLCPPTQHFAKCVYQMAALYQGVADTGSTQSSVKQEYGRPASNNWGAVAGLASLPSITLFCNVCK